MDLAVTQGDKSRWSSWLDDGERARADRFHFEVHRDRYVAAHGQLRGLLGRYAGVPPEELRFEQEERGKPRLAAAFTSGMQSGDLFFNLSHSADEGLLAITRVAPLGADIEVQRDLADLETLATSHFTRSEMDELHSLPQARRHDGFFAAWTRKEAYVKALGAGLSVPLDGFEVTLHPDHPAGMRSIDGSEDKARAWTLWAGRPTHASWAAVAVRAPSTPVRTFSLGQLALP